MGKKSKQRKSNKVSTTCYHGCTKKEFNNAGDHYKVLDDCVKCNKDDLMEFVKNNKRVLVDPTFSCFVSARITDDYLKGKNNDILHRRLWWLLHLRYKLIPKQEGKDVKSPESNYTTNYNKYSRDIQTERGRINCMAREIPCDCMEEKRIEAKSMAKVAICCSCGKDFSKEKMLRCKGCNYVQYCSTECSITHWPEHKEWCKRFSVSSASATTLGSLPLFEESTDVDAGEE